MYLAGLERSPMFCLSLHHHPYFMNANSKASCESSHRGVCASWDSMTVCDILRTIWLISTKHAQMKTFGWMKS